MTEEESRNLDAKTKAMVADEIADVQNYLVRLADKLDIDILEAAEVKFAKNERNTPQTKCGVVRRSIPSTTRGLSSFWQSIQPDFGSSENLAVAELSDPNVSITSFEF